MIYEHKLLNTFALPCKRHKPNVSFEDETAYQLDEMSKQGWELVSVLNEFKFVLRREIVEVDQKTIGL